MFVGDASVSRAVLLGRWASGTRVSKSVIALVGSVWNPRVSERSLEGLAAAYDRVVVRPELSGATLSA